MGSKTSKDAEADVAWRIATRRKRISAPVDLLLDEVGKAARGTERGDRDVETGLRWSLHLYRAADGRLLSRFIVDARVVLGLDFHADETELPDRSMFPAGYHWDVYPPIVAEKRRILACGAGAIHGCSMTDADRVALALLRQFWNVRFERESAVKLRRRAR